MLNTVDFVSGYQSCDLLHRDVIRLKMFNTLVILSLYLNPFLSLFCNLSFKLEWMFLWIFNLPWHYANDKPFWKEVIYSLAQK